MKNDCNLRLVLCRKLDDARNIFHSDFQFNAIFYLKRKIHRNPLWNGKHSIDGMMDDSITLTMLVKWLTDASIYQTFYMVLRTISFTINSLCFYLIFLPSWTQHLFFLSLSFENFMVSSIHLANTWNVEMPMSKTNRLRPKIGLCRGRCLIFASYFPFLFLSVHFFFRRLI